MRITAVVDNAATAHTVAVDTSGTRRQRRSPLSVLAGTSFPFLSQCRGVLVVTPIAFAATPIVISLVIMHMTAQIRISSHLTV